MDGSTPRRRWPSEATVHRVHDRYLYEVIEALNVCPFARRSREQGRVHRPVFWADEHGPDADECAGRLRDLVKRHTDAEIVLLTFIVPDDHLWAAPQRFELFCRELRERYDALGSERFYMVTFHPKLGDPIKERGRPITSDNLVPLLRRTPDPVIQCVRADVLDEVRKQAQGMANARFQRSLETVEPEIRALILHSVSADSELSADIAQKNFESVGQGAGHERLEQLIQDIARERDRAYAADAGETY